MAMMKMNWATGRMEAVEFPELKRGQILHCWSGMCGSHYEKAVLIATTKDDFGIHYKAVALEDHHYIHPTAPEVFERAGKIGCFYKNGEVIPEEETAKYEMLALQRQQKIAAEQEQKRLETEKLRSIGKARFDAAIAKHGMPQALIVAHLREDDSDLQSDYHGAHTVATVILAFSKHTRNNFKEFRKAALNSDNPDLKELANAPEEWEHRENYSLGSGLYLGKSKYSGWMISKHKIFKESDLANYYLYAGYDEGFCVK